MRSEAQKRLAVLMFLSATGLLAQDAPLPTGSIQLNLPNDSPLAVLSMGSDQSRASSRGAAMVLDLHMALTLRNASSNRIHGVTLRVVTQEATMGGKNWVTIPSLNVSQGEVFPVRIDMQLVRPAQSAGGPLVQVDLDGVLFQDLSFYGPDRLNSRRILTAYELEAQRDREHFKRVLSQGGKEGLRKQVLESIARQSELSPLTVRVRRGGQSVTSAAVAPEHAAQFAFLQFPDSPVEPLEGWVQIAGNEARAPRIAVKNRSNRPIKYVELGWVVSDQAGKQYMAGSLPSSEANLNIPPGQTARVLQESSLSFLSDGRPVNVRKMTGFINQVQFADGKVWVPSRQNLDDPTLQRTMASSSEELRLSDLYRRKGIDALVEELKKY